MRTLQSIIKPHRRIARDTTGRQEFADSDEYFDGGIDVLARWLGDFIGDDDLVSLVESIRLIMLNRVRDQVTGPVTGAMDSRATTGFASRYPQAAKIKRETWGAR
jgi:hypothetical protein